MSSTFSRYDSHRLVTEFNSGTSFTHTIPCDRQGKVMGKETWKRGSNDRIGTGCFGDVWKETCTQSGAVRAVKQIRNTMWRDKSEELGALIELSQYSQNFVQFFGWFQDTANIYLAMEYVQCGDLDGFIKESDGLLEFDVTGITRQLLDGLEIMHEHKLCHRDVKPGNIFVVQWFPLIVKLGDFGISKRFGDHTDLRTQAGSVGYMAPELFDDFSPDTSVYTEAIDIWSLGCVIYKMITKDVPFQTHNDLSGYIRGRATFPHRQIKEFGSTGLDFITRLMTPLPNRRLTAAQARADQWLASDRAPSQRRVGSSTHMDPDKYIRFRAIRSALLCAVASGPIDRVRGILDKGGDTIASNELGYEILGTAVGLKRMDVATLLVEKGANNLKGHDGRSSYTSLHLAAERGNAELVRFLLEKGVNAMSRSHEGLTPLQSARRQGQATTANILIGYGAK